MQEINAFLTFSHTLYLHLGLFHSLQAPRRHFLTFCRWSKKRKVSKRRKQEKGWKINNISLQNVLDMSSLLPWLLTPCVDVIAVHWATTNAMRETHWKWRISFLWKTVVTFLHPICHVSSCEFVHRLAVRPMSGCLPLITWTKSYSQRGK